MEIWRLIDSGPCEPAFNMALDEALMRHADRPVLRFYSWDPPAISLGYFQPYSEAEDWARRGYVVVRRPTGGGAIFHFRELTFCVALPRGHPLAESTEDAYEAFHGAIVAALQALGVPASIRGRTQDAPPHQPLCFMRTIFCDIVAAGRKIVGSAQRRTPRGFLQHGSIPIEKNPLTPDAAYVRMFAPKADYSTLAKAIVRAFILKMKATFRICRPTWQEIQTAKKLLIQKYGSDAWTRKR